MINPMNQPDNHDPCHGIVAHSNYQECPVKPDSHDRDELDAILAAHEGYSLEEYQGKTGGHDFSRNESNLKLKADLTAYTHKQTEQAVLDAYKQGVRDGWNKSGEGRNAEFSYPNPEETENEVVNECLVELHRLKEGA